MRWPASSDSRTADRRDVPSCMCFGTCRGGALLPPTLPSRRVETPEMTLQDWMNRGQHAKGRKINMDTPKPLTDAEMAAKWAIEALEAGRYELGRALVNLAANAARMEATPAPIVAAAAATVLLESLGDGGVAQAAQAELFGDGDRTQAVAQSARCAFTQGAETCRNVIVWHHGNIGDAEHPAIVAGWYHLDSQLDTYHQAIPPAS